MREAASRKKREYLSAETREKFSRARKNTHLSADNPKAHPVVKLDLRFNYIDEYPTLRDAAKALEKEPGKPI